MKTKRFFASLRMTTLAFLCLLAGFAFSSHAAWSDDEDELKISTEPLGSPFYRHLAQDYNLDIRQLIRFEKNGIGRSEMVTLILIAQSSGTVSASTGTVLSGLAKRRINDLTPLETLAAEIKLDYPTLYKKVRAIKEDIDARPTSTLPPPVYEEPPKPEEKKPQKKKKKEKEEKEEKKDKD